MQEYSKVVSHVRKNIEIMFEAMKEVNNYQFRPSTQLQATIKLKISLLLRPRGLAYKLEDCKQLVSK